MTVAGRPGLEALEEERDFCLRSLRDLDAEFEAGDMDEVDYRALRDAYTVRAATALRALDAAPAGAVGEAIAASGNGTHPAGVEHAETPGRPRQSRRRRAMVAAGALVIAAGASWAVVASSATRLPGQQITGRTIGSEQVASELLAAQHSLAKGDDLSALRDYQKVLSSQPDQPEALTGAGWLLAQTQQPSLLKQGLAMLASAERAAPDYAPAHLYRGVALLSEDDYADAVPELQWYLGHSPDPQLVPKVRQALQQAEAGAKQQG